MTANYFLTRFAQFLMLALPLSVSAKNTRTVVEQVPNGTVVVDTDADYVVTGTTPFTASGVVNITNTDHAVLILQGVKPSAAVRLLAAHVQINGEKAVDGTNCQVKLYNRGTIVLPYAKDMKPLTVYSDQKFKGTAVSDFGLEHNGGFMNTLTEAKLNNKIRSFKLKRGYMVTFATQARGRGYSRCFIADDEDLEVESLPTVLDQRISSYRVFKWYDTGKPQVAATTDKNIAGMLNTTACYDWAAGYDMSPDFECVPHHIYEDWPSPAACGSATYSPHMQTNNEPRNSADDHPQDLATILNNWENLMATGMRLCSPSSWDGSDYWNGTGFLKEFFDSIDARGWRCDILDMHCYWAEGSFPNLKNWVNAVHRPIWISEWCWGASWNNNGAFAGGVTEGEVRDALSRICGNLNSYDYVERYYYWNGERDPSRIYKDGRLTPAGEMYAQLDGGVGYNGKYDYVPKTPRQYAPSNFKVDYDADNHTATITWTDKNGEYNQAMRVERTTDGTTWTTINTPEVKDAGGNYTYTDPQAVDGYGYRVYVKDLNGKEYTTRATYALTDNISVGDVVTMDGHQYYLGGNIITNGDFDLDMQGWLNGEGNPIGQPQFQVLPIGSIDKGSYLQAWCDGGAAKPASLKTSFDIVPNSRYYYAAAALNAGGYAKLELSKPEGTATAVATLTNGTAWEIQSFRFESGDNTVATFSFRWLNANAQFDKLTLCQLFDTREAAVADGVAKARLRIEAIQRYNTLLPGLNDELKTIAERVAGTGEEDLATLQTAISNATEALSKAEELKKLNQQAIALSAMPLPGSEQLKLLAAQTMASSTTAELTANMEALQQAVKDFATFSASTVALKNPSFAATTGWTAKAGTYQGGDQRANTVLGQKCWNAWWSGVSSTSDETLAVTQTVEQLPAGFYVLQCKATTEHYCLSDQHAFISNGTQTAVSPTLTYDRFDYPFFASASTSVQAQAWETLTTAPLFVDEGGTLTVGFESSKQGATDNAWRKYGDKSSTGDKREGWWCATAFSLQYVPVYQLTLTPNTWGVLCLPFAVKADAGVALYQIAGITADYQQLCVEPVDQVSPGVPCLFYSTVEKARFFEFGTKSSIARAGENNLMGSFSARTLFDGYVLRDGSWQRIEKSVRITANQAYLTTVSGIPVVESWQGATVPISGAAEEMAALGIEQTAVAPASELQRVYTIDGRQATEGARSGLFIEKSAGKQGKKVIRK